MSITVRSYFNISECGAAFAEICRAAGKKALFIVPARLDRDALLELICGGAPLFGRRPDIWTVGDMLAELQHATGEYERVIDPPDHKLILRYILAQFLTETGEKGVTLAPGYGHRGFVSVLGENIKDLLAEEVSVGSLRSALDGADDFSPENVLAALYERYIEYLEDYKLADAAQIFTLARRKLLTDAGRALISGRKIVFAGFLSFTSSQLKLVKALGELADLEMFQPETGLDEFHDGILQLNESFDKRAKWDVPVVKIEAGNPQIEIEAVARELALWACGEGGLTSLGEFRGYGDVGITTNAASLAVVKYALSRYKIPYNVQEGGSVGESLLGGLPQLIWRAHSSGWGNRETALLLSSPLLFGQDGGLPEYDAAALPEGLDAWLSVLPEDARDGLQLADELCREFDKGLSPVETLLLWREFLKKRSAVERAASAASDIAKLDGRVKETASALDELDKKIKKLVDDSKSIGPAGEEIKLCGADAAAFIAEWALTATLPVQLPQNRAVTLYVGAPPTLASHRCWIMTGVDSNRWPGALRESMLLGDDKKAKFNAASSENEEPSHLPELHEEREQKEAVFRRILSTGRECAIISRAVYNEKGEECGESRFATSALKTFGERRWRLVNTIVYPAESALPDGESAWFPQVEVLCTPVSHGRDDVNPIGHTARDERPRIRISDIDRWNVCPYLYWCERRLGLDARRPSLYDNRKAGNVAHLVWDDTFSAKEENPKLSIQRHVMDNWGRYKLAEYPELDTEPRLARYEARLCRQIFDMASALDELEDRLAHVSKLRTETEVKLDGVEIDGALFVGQADRIDTFDDGIVVLDYKLGRSANHEKELQVAAYCYVLSETRGDAIDGFGWMGHTGTSLSGYFAGDYFAKYAFGGTKKKKNGDVSSKMEEAYSLMERMAESVRNGVYEPKYKVDNNICKKCAFFTLCRKREKRAYIDSLLGEGENNDGE